MRIENLFRLGLAMHSSYMVDSPSQTRGGLLLTAAPGNLKTTIVKSILGPFPNALVYSDLTLKQLAVVRSQISSGIYQTLGFTELEKIYARQLSVALNFEGVMKAMVEEGFSHFAFEDQRCWVPTARCFVMAAVLDNLYRFHFPRWQENGFLRRFVVFKYMLSYESKKKLKDSIHDGELMPLSPISLTLPSNVLKDDITKEESKKLEEILASDDAINTPLNLLRKSLVILKWKHKNDRPKNRKGITPMEVIQDLKDGISPTGGTLEI